MGGRPKHSHPLQLMDSRRNDPPRIKNQLKETTMKNLPKSLHTITAWVNVARFLAKQNGLSPNNAAHAAAHVLRLDEMTDTHELRAAVIKQLERA